MVVVPVCLNGRCCSERACGYFIVLTKIKVMSFASSGFSKRCCQCDFFGIFKGRKIIPEPYMNSKYPIRRLLWWYKTLLDAFWTQAYSEPIQASKMEYFCAKVNDLKSLTGHTKTLHLRSLKGFWIWFCWKARQV